MLTRSWSWGNDPALGIWYHRISERDDENKELDSLTEDHDRGRYGGRICDLFDPHPETMNWESPSVNSPDAWIYRDEVQASDSSSIALKIER